MLLTVLTLLSHLALLISATPGHMPEKRSSSGYSYYPRSKSVSPRSISVNARYSNVASARRSHNSETSDGGSYSGPPQILQTATTLINVHPTAGYRQYSRNHGSGTGAGGNEHRQQEKYESERSSSHFDQSSQSTSTTTEVNMYQEGKKVVDFKMKVPGGHMNYLYPHQSSRQSSYSLQEQDSSPRPPQPSYDDYGYGSSENQAFADQNLRRMSTSTTTELNMYQGGKKVVDFRMNSPGGHMDYPYPHQLYQSPHRLSNSLHEHRSSEEYIPSLSPRPPQPQSDGSKIHVQPLSSNSDPRPESWIPKSPSTTTELNLKVNLQGGPMYYPYPPPYDPARWIGYNTPPPPPTRPTTQASDSKSESVDINISPHVNNQDVKGVNEPGPGGEKKYKVLICKLQQQ